MAGEIEVITHGFFVGIDTVESLTLYDKTEMEVGSAERRDSDWYCELHYLESVTTAVVPSLNEAFAWLRGKRDQYYRGGFVTAIADFRIDESGSNQGKHAL
jgi:hypothetical protein